MASGHVNRANRPNTWLHRPSLRRQDSPCQPGAVHTWPIATLPQEFMSAMSPEADKPEPTRITQLGHQKTSIPLPACMFYGFVLTLSGVEPAETWSNDGPDPLVAA